MRYTFLLATLASLVPVIMALQPGDIPIEVAVRSDANGNIQHFYKRDQDEYYQKRALEARQAEDLSQDPQSDTYPVQADAAGNLTPFKGVAA